MAAQLKASVSSVFKMHGFTLRSDASQYLLEVLLPFSEVEREEALERLIEAIQKQPLDSTMIDRRLCEEAVLECNKEDEEDQNDLLFNVISAFNVPRFVYRHDRKKFLSADQVGNPKSSLLPSAEAKSRMFIERYNILHQRTLRHELFSAPVVGAPVTEQSSKFQLQPVEFLQGNHEGKLVVLGMLTQIREGKWHLEDPTGIVELNLKQTAFHSGLFTEGCFVLAEGNYVENVLHVQACGFPPSETARVSRDYFGNLNFFGGSYQTCVASSKRLQVLEQDKADAMIVFLSDVCLDVPKVFTKLRIMFDGYSEVPPVAFIICGNFTSRPHGYKQPAVIKDGFNSFASLISEFPTLVKRSKFVFVPGPDDPGLGAVLPRPPLPSALTRDIEDKLPGAVFATNPCRVQYCTQEIVVFREEISSKLCRNCLKFPADNDIPLHLSKTLVCQASLCPLPLSTIPVHWDFAHALSLYPLPDLVVCADSSEPFSNSVADCTVANPGSFARNDFGFHVYYPQSKQVESSRIGDS